MDPIKSFESVDRRTVATLASCLGTVPAMICRLNEVDLSAGAGVIDSNTKCLWTKDHRRITLTLTSDGGFIGSASKEADPLCPQYQGEKHEQRD